MNGPNALDVLRRVAPRDVGRRGPERGFPLLDRVQQDLEPARGVGMVPGRMELDELRVGHEVDGCSDPGRQSLGHRIHAPTTQEGGRLRPQGGLIFEGRERGGGV